MTGIVEKRGQDLWRLTATLGYYRKGKLIRKRKTVKTFDIVEATDSVWGGNFSWRIGNIINENKVKKTYGGLRIWQAV